MKYIVILALLVLVSCKETKTEQVEIIRPIKHLVIGNTNNESTRTFSGNVKASDEIELSFRASGIITTLNAKVGTKVKKGELIAKLDNVQAQLAYEQTLTSLNSAESALATSKSQLERVRTLYEKGSSALSDYEQAKNAYQANLDQYESAKRNISIKKSQIAYGYIYAPKSGVITSRNVSINETANAGQVVAVLSAGKDLNIETGLPEAMINKIHLNMDTDIAFSAIDGKTFKGQIIEISPIADAQSATYPIKIEIKDATDKIKQGMTASVTFDLDKEAGDVDNNAIIIPVKTVGEDGKGNYVFVVNSEDGKVGIVKKQHITLGKITNQGFEVVKGLNKGDMLVTAGVNSLLDGQKVKL